MKEFKIGEKCYVEWEIINTNNSNSNTYPISAININGRNSSFTIDGLSIRDDKFPALKHIEDLNIKSEFPKWMLVKLDNEYKKRKVIAKDDTHYVYILYGNENIVNGIGHTIITNVKEIEQENQLKLELLTKADELIQKAQELKEQANKL